MSNNYFYFATHTINNLVYNRLKASVTYKKLNSREQVILDEFVKTYPEYDYSDSPENRAEEFINRYEEDFYDLIEKLGIYKLVDTMVDYLGFQKKWFSGTKGFGKGSRQRGRKISEEKLIEEMTDSNSTIKKLYESGGEDVINIKPFLPALMISLDTNTRNKDFMKHKHTGRFALDFDKFKTQKDAMVWLKKLQKGTKHIKCYLGFISPSGKGVKLFCKVDTSDSEFQKNFQSYSRDQVKAYHKEWYEGAILEFQKTFPGLKDYIDEGTNDAERLTYIPFIDDKAHKFFHNSKCFSKYGEVAEIARANKEKELQEKIKENKEAVRKTMIKHGVKSEKDAYHLFVKEKSKNFDVTFEFDKFKKVVTYIVELSKEEVAVKKWLAKNFDDYDTLYKLHWSLYGIFGEQATVELKKLIPLGSNKLVTNSGASRWSVVTENSYDDKLRQKLTPAAFYSTVFEIGKVRDYTLSNFGFNSTQISNFKLINKYYEDYKFSLELGDNEICQEKNVYLKEIESYLNQKKNRLPLIKDLAEMSAEVALGAHYYLNKDEMEKLFQKKYSDKRFFILRSQCGTTVPS